MAERGNTTTDPTPSPDASAMIGSGLVKITVGGSAVFAVLGLAASMFDGALTGAYVIVSLVEFFLGMVVFALAFLRAVDRSRTEEIGIGGLFFASGSAPRRVQLVLVGSLVLQIVVSIVVASLHLYTALAFGVLAPMWALGLTGLWVAVHGTFPERTPEPTRSGRRDAARRAHRRSSAVDGGSGAGTGESGS